MTNKTFVWLVLVWVVALQPQARSAMPKLSLQTAISGQGIQLHLDNAEAVSKSGVWLELQRSTDLEHWEELLAAPSTSFIGDGSSLIFEELAQGQAFFRLRINHRVTATASSGEDIFGFASSFARELEKAGQLSVEDFLERYSDAGERLGAIDFNPEESEFWDEFNAIPTQRMPPGKYQDKELRLLDFRLNDEELALFKKNGMVVSARLGAPSFVDAYYGVFTEDLPVFVTADSIMHAWHMSYVEMLKELENAFLAPKLSEFLNALHDALPGVAEEVDADVLGESLHDVDYYLTVARSLFAGSLQNDQLGASGAKAKKTLDDIKNGYVGGYDLFGRQGDNAWVDFSQMTVRGHYTSSISLSRYFQAAMWCGRIDFRVAGPEQFSSPRELGAAIILNALVERSGTLQQWKDFDDLLKVFVGVSDSMGFDQLGLVLASAGIQDPGKVSSLDALKNVQDAIQSGNFGLQQILSHPFVATPEGTPLVLPRSFTVFGQKFVMDSWAMGQLVFDKVTWDDRKLPRRLPSALDVAFTVFGNRNAADLLAERILREDGVPFRDGYPIQHHLTSLHEVFNQMPDASWEESFYTGWLKALRELSADSGSSSGFMPQAFRTKAWGNRIMNTQLASWTELRHDTVLYAKQSSSPPLLCSFPYSYVEPSVGFWEVMKDLCGSAAQKLGEIDSSGRVRITNEWGGGVWKNIREIVGKQINHLNNFGETLQTLLEIAKRQDNQEVLTDEQSNFLKNMVEIMSDYVGQRTYTGWYPKLFYSDLPLGYVGPLPTGHPSDKWDPVVTDVHTDFPDQIHGDPGTVLLEGVGNVAMMLVAIDCEDGESRVYAGPAYTHYEFTSGAGKFDRMTDEQWKQKVKANDLPAQPEWTEDFFVPGDLRLPSWATAENEFPF